jgi:tRNA U34 5-carboxymethylaminomethyl modifying GTPase MnmE/TrmE
MELELGSQLPAAPLVVVNKIDLAEVSVSIAGCISTSALTGAGLYRLLAAISARLVPNPPAPNESIPFTDRQSAALKQALESLTRGDRNSTRVVLAQLLSR